MGRLETIHESLEQVAATGDPAEAIYRTLFARRPELEELFVLDKDGAVRGSMLERAIDVILDHAQNGTVAQGILQGERLQHYGYGVPPELFDEFFLVVRDTFRDLAGANWTSEMDAEWERMIAEIVQQQ